jgi:hypothetical protein
MFKPGPVTEFEAWIRLVARAAYTDTHHRVGVVIVPVKRGSLYATLRDLQAEFKWRSDKRVRGFLQRLEASGMITMNASKHGRSRDARKTQITICNYDVYQSGERNRDTGRTQDGRTADALKNKRTTNKGEADASPGGRGQRLPADWCLPVDWGEWAVSELGMNPEQVRQESEKFRDYWSAKVGKDAAKLDWQATWRNWCRKAVNSPRRQKRRPDSDERFARKMEMAARLDGCTETDGEVDHSASGGRVVTLLQARNQREG